MAAVSRGRGRTRADANLPSGSVSDTTSAPAPVPVRASSPAANRVTSASAGRLTSPRADRITAAPVTPAGGGDDPDSSQISSSQTRPRQATVLSRRSQLSEADRKVSFFVYFMRNI